MNSTCECDNTVGTSSNNPDDFWKAPYIYAQLVIVPLLTILLIQFMYSVYKKHKEILKRYDTVSSFCSQKSGWENRFLLIFTLVIAQNLLCLTFDEFNGRAWNMTQSEHSFYFAVFFIECIAIILFPFVGIFYTEGKHRDPLERNQDYECPCGNLSIATSSKLHSLGAYGFLGGLGVISIVWGRFFVILFKDNGHPHLYGLGIFSLCWSVLNLVFCGIFIAVKTVLRRDYRMKTAWYPGKIFRTKTNLDLDLSRYDTESKLLSMKAVEERKSQRIDEENEMSPKPMPKLKKPSVIYESGSLHSMSVLSDFGGEDLNGAEDVIGTEQKKWRYYSTKLRYLSFALEGTIGISAIAIEWMNALIRIYINLHQNEFDDLK